MGSPSGQSALIVEVPEAEFAVQRHRDRLDANARLGVPAHFTVLFPFMPVADLAPTTLAHLSRLLATKPAFSIDLTRTAWFADQVLWLAPEDPQPFHDLTDLVHAAYPNFPPYRGVHEDLVPHLTVAHGCELPQMQDAEQHCGPVCPSVRTSRK